MKDALKFQILALVFASLPVLTTFALSFCEEGPVKKVVVYSTIALIIFSGMYRYRYFYSIPFFIDPTDSIFNDIF